MHVPRVKAVRLRGPDSHLASVGGTLWPPTPVQGDDAQDAYNLIIRPSPGQLLEFIAHRHVSSGSDVSCNSRDQSLPVAIFKVLNQVARERAPRRVREGIAAPPPERLAEQR